MGTRALIAYQNSRTVYEANLLNYDGYPEHMKEVLPTIDTLKKAKEIVKAGELREIQSYDNYDVFDDPIIKPGKPKKFLNWADLCNYAKRSVDYVYVYIASKGSKLGSWIVYDVDDMEDDPYNVKLNDENQINCY